MFRKVSLLLALTASASSASAAVVTFSGALTTTDPTFNRPSGVAALSTSTTAAYDTYTFVADAAGPYSVSGDYTAGGVGSAGLDGFLFLYAPTFVPATPLVGLLAADDDNDPDGAGAGTTLDGSLIPSTGAFGPATTTSVLTLVPGTTYTLVVASFGNNTAAGAVGPYTVTVTGAVPEPASMSAVAGLAAFALRRRRGA